jgi:hypothetical protein
MRKDEHLELCVFIRTHWDGETDAEKRLKRRVRLGRRKREMRNLARVFRSQSEVLFALF